MFIVGNVRCWNLHNNNTDIVEKSWVFGLPRWSIPTFWILYEDQLHCSYIAVWYRNISISFTNYFSRPYVFDLPRWLFPSC